MFDDIAKPKTSSRKRLFVLLSLVGFGMAIVELIRFLHMRQPSHAVMACIWLAIAAGWAYRFRHFGESQITSLDAKAPK
jgi:hypothetical protein